MVKRELKKDLSFPNPAYEDALNFGRTTRGVPSKIRLYEEVNGLFEIPRGAWETLSVILNTHKIEIEVVDNTVKFDPSTSPKDLKLRDYQVPWVDNMLKSTQGMGVAPPGAGKTIMMLDTYAKLGQPCLWLTHTRRLTHQAAESAKKFLGVEAGFIGGGKEDIKHFTIGMIPTLAKKSDAELAEYSSQFGAIIADECFVAGTMVGKIPIEEIKVGDLVDSYLEL